MMRRFRLLLVIIAMLLLALLFSFFSNQRNYSTQNHEKRQESAVDRVADELPRENVQPDSLRSTTTSAVQPTSALCRIEARYPDGAKVPFDVLVQRSVNPMVGYGPNSRQSDLTARDFSIGTLVAGGHLEISRTILPEGAALSGIGPFGITVAAVWNGLTATLTFPLVGDVEITVRNASESEELMFRLSSSDLHYSTEQASRKIQLIGLPYGTYTASVTSGNLKALAIFRHLQGHTTVEIELVLTQSFRLQVLRSDNRQPIDDAELLDYQNYHLDISYEGPGTFAIRGIYPGTPFLPLLVRAREFPDHYLELYRDVTRAHEEKEVYLARGALFRFDISAVGRPASGAKGMLFYEVPDWLETNRSMSGQATGTASESGRLELFAPHGARVIGAAFAADQDSYSASFKWDGSPAPDQPIPISLELFSPLRILVQGDLDQPQVVRIGVFSSLASDKYLANPIFYYCRVGGELWLTRYPAPHTALFVEGPTLSPIEQIVLFPPYPDPVIVQVPVTGTITLTFMSAAGGPEQGTVELRSIDQLRILATQPLDGFGAVRFDSINERMGYVLLYLPGQSEPIDIGSVTVGSVTKTYKRHPSTGNFLPVGP